MTTTITLYGVSFADSDFLVRGHLDTVVVDGTSYPRFQALWVAGLLEIDDRIGQVGGLGVAMAYAAETGSTADAAPGDGKLTWNNATQASATTIYLDADDANGTDLLALIDTLADSDSTVKGSLRLTQRDDNTKWITYDLTAVTTATGYRKLTVAATGYSAASPFADGAALTLSFSRTGDKGETGSLAGGTMSGDLAFAGYNATGIGTLSATTATITTLTASGVTDLQGLVKSRVAGQTLAAQYADVDATADTDLTVDGPQILPRNATGDHTFNIFGGMYDSAGVYRANGYVLDLINDIGGSGGRNFTFKKGNERTFSDDLQSTAEAGETRPWTDTSSSLTLNAAIGPDGRSTLAKVVVDAATSDHARTSTITGLSPNQTLTMSVIVRDAGDGLSVAIYLYDAASSANQIRVFFNPATGTIIQGPTNGGAATGATAAVTALSNSCYRLDLTGHPNTSGSNLGVLIRITNGTNTSFLGDGASGVYVGTIQVNPGQPKGLITVGASRDIDEWLPSTPDFASQAAGVHTRVEIPVIGYDGYVVATYRVRA